MKEDMQDLVICECNSPDHQVIISSFKVDALNPYPEAYMHTHLTKHSFWYRLKYGLKYIFGYKSRYGAWDEIILGPKHIPSLHRLIESLEQPKYEDTGNTDSRGA